jgi:hypothetical protein
MAKEDAPKPKNIISKILSLIFFSSISELLFIS